MSWCEFGGFFSYHAFLHLRSPASLFLSLSQFTFSGSPGQIMHLFLQRGSNDRPSESGSCYDYCSFHHAFHITKSVQKPRKPRASIRTVAWCAQYTQCRPERVGGSPTGEIVRWSTAGRRPSRRKHTSHVCMFSGRLSLVCQTSISHVSNRLYACPCLGYSILLSFPVQSHLTNTLQLFQYQRFLLCHGKTNTNCSLSGASLSYCPAFFC